MADRISSDNPSIATLRATLEETATGVRIELPEAATDGTTHTVDDREGVVRVVIDEHERFARLEAGLAGDALTIRGVYERPDAARDPREGRDLLADWVEGHDVRAGGSVLVDVVEPGFLYGLRPPGETVVYEAHEPPSSSLQDIAAGLGDGE